MRKNSTFYCFSPPVMIATFAIEIMLLVYTLVRYKMNTLTRLVSAILVLLAGFQYAEFHVCEAIGEVSVYSRLGYIAITMLPPVGLHLSTKIAGVNPRRLIGTAYATGIMFALTFGFSQSAFNSYECAGNYAVFHLTQNISNLYSFYYYSWLFIGIALCLRYRKKASQTKSEALKFQAFGYISFILPTGIVNLINPTTLSGVPSIMCGFAVIYAFILVFEIVPRVLSRKETAHNTASA